VIIAVRGMRGMDAAADAGAAANSVAFSPTTAAAAAAASAGAGAEYFADLGPGKCVSTDGHDPVFQFVSGAHGGDGGTEVGCRHACLVSTMGTMQCKQFFCSKACSKACICAVAVWNIGCMYLCFVPRI
jgi:hypothetical protein